MYHNFNFNSIFMRGGASSVSREDVPNNIVIYDKEKIPIRLIHELRQKIKTHLQLFCMNEINDEFFEEAYEECDFILTLEDVSQSGIQSLRGFSLINKGISYGLEEGDEDKFLYIALICCAPRPGVKTRLQSLRQGGQIILQSLKQFCIDSNYKGIGLRALQKVIPYYSRYEWEFKNHCRDRPYTLRGQSKEDIRKLYKVLQTDDETIINKQLDIFTRFLNELYGENYYSLDLVEDAIEEETESLRQQYIESLQGDGWPMLWCNPHYTSS